MNIKINIKRSQITKEEIAANKNFGEVLKEYKTLHRHFYSTTWFYACLSAAAAIIVAVIVYFEPAPNKNREAFINPPLAKVRIIPSRYSMNAENGTTITYKSGSVVKVPPKAFVDKNGNPVVGKVDISYRELNDPIDFFLSGIPMNYDSAGVKYTFESAGMLEIHATQDGKELDLNPEKELAVALASHQSGKKFNLYKLDTEKKQWIYSGQEQLPDMADVSNESNREASENSSPSEGIDSDHTSVSSPQLAVLDIKLENAENELKKSEITVKRIEASKPFEPKEETKGHRRFAVYVSNLKDFPEFTIYKDVMFQAGEENKNFDRNAYNIAWEDAKLKEYKKGESYMLTLQNGNEVASYIVHPVFEGEGFVTAQKIYKEKMSEYQEALLEHKATEGEKQQELEARVEVIKENRKAEVASIMQGKSKETKTGNPGNLTFHNFSIHSCGIWNLDNPAFLPQGALVNARFTDEKGEELRFADDKVYLVEKGRNILFSFSGNPDKIGTISYNPEKQNMIWGVTSDHKIAVFNYDDFKAVGKQSGDYTFKMQVSNIDLADETQVEYYLNI